MNPARPQLGFFLYLELTCCVSLELTFCLSFMGLGVTCNDFWGLGEKGKGVTCNGFWGLGEKGKVCNTGGTHTYMHTPTPFFVSTSRHLNVLISIARYLIHRVLTPLLGAGFPSIHRW